MVLRVFHQVNLEYSKKRIFYNLDGNRSEAVPSALPTKSMTQRFSNWVGHANYYPVIYIL